MNKRNFKYFISVCLILTFSVMFANKTPPHPKEGGDVSPPIGLPIDGGVIYLVISGLALGFYAIKKKK